MKLPNDDRLTLRDGLTLLIQAHHEHIRHIRTKTEADYSAAKIAAKFRPEGFSVEREQEREIAKVNAEIKRLNELSHLLNDGSHHILIVSDRVRLELSAAEK